MLKTTALWKAIAGVFNHSSQHIIEPLESRQLLTAIIGSSGNDEWYVRLKPTNTAIVQVFEGSSSQGTILCEFNRTTLGELSISGGAGNDRLTLDYSLGSLVKDDVIDFDGGDDVDRLIFLGKSNYRAEVSPESVRVYLQDMAYSNVESLQFSNFKALSLLKASGVDEMTVDRDGNIFSVSEIVDSSTCYWPSIAVNSIPKIAVDAGEDDQCIALTLEGDAGDDYRTVVKMGEDASVTVNGDGLLTLNYARQLVVGEDVMVGLVGSSTLDNLTLGDGSALRMESETPRLLVVEGNPDTCLALGDDANIDLYHSGMIVREGGLSSTLTGDIYGMLQAGSSAEQGIYTTASNLRVGWINQVQVNPLTEFFGREVGSEDILIRATYAGDQNLDGALGDNGELAYQSPPTGQSMWWDGDYNYDGYVNFNDYEAIATNLAAPWVCFDLDIGASCLCYTGDYHSIIEDNEEFEISVTVYSNDLENVGAFVVYSDGTVTPVSFVDPEGEWSYYNPPTISFTHAFDGSGSEWAIIYSQIYDVVNETTVASAPNFEAFITFDVTDGSYTISGQLYEDVYELNLQGYYGVTQWTVDWGDGSDEQIISEYNATAYHVYSELGDYEIDVTGTDDSSTWSNTLEADVVLTGPSWLSLSAISNGAYQLTWDDHLFEEGYVVETLEWTSIEGGYAWVATQVADCDADETQCELNDSLVDHDSIFRIRSYVEVDNERVYSDADLIVSADDWDDEDLGLTINLEEPRVEMAWYWSWNTVALMRSEDSGATWTSYKLDPMINAFWDYEVANGTFLYRLLEDDGSGGYYSDDTSTGCIGWEEPTGSTTMGLTAEDVYDDGKLVFGKIQVEWEEINFAVSYDVYRSESPDCVLSESNRIATGVTSTSYLDEDLEPGVEYFYHYKANFDGDSAAGPGGDSEGGGSSSANQNGSSAAAIPAGMPGAGANNTAKARMYNVSQLEKSPYDDDDVCYFPCFDDQLFIQDDENPIKAFSEEDAISRAVAGYVFEYGMIGNNGITYIYPDNEGSIYHYSILEYDNNNGIYRITLDDFNGLDYQPVWFVKCHVSNSVIATDRSAINVNNNDSNGDNTCDNTGYVFVPQDVPISGANDYDQMCIAYPTNSYYDLTIRVISNNVRVWWQNANSSYDYASYEHAGYWSKTWSKPTVFYVEGLSPSASPDDAIIQVELNGVFSTIYYTVNDYTGNDTLYHVSRNVTGWNSTVIEGDYFINGDVNDVFTVDSETEDQVSGSYQLVMGVVLSGVSGGVFNNVPYGTLWNSQTNSFDVVLLVQEVGSYVTVTSDNIIGNGSGHYFEIVGAYYCDVYLEYPLVLACNGAPEALFDLYYYLYEYMPPEVPYPYYPDTWSRYGFRSDSSGLSECEGRTFAIQLNQQQFSEFLYSGYNVIDYEYGFYNSSDMEYFDCLWSSEGGSGIWASGTDIMSYFISINAKLLYTEEWKRETFSWDGAGQSSNATGDLGNSN